MTDPFATEDEALQALDRYLNKGFDSRALPLFEEYWAYLLEEGGIFEDKYDYQTCNLYDTVLAKTVRGSALGRTRIDQITKPQIQRHINRLYKNYKESTVRRYGSCIHTVLQNAVEEKVLWAKVEHGVLVPANPADGIDYRPIPEAPSYIYSEQQLSEIPDLLFEYNPRLSAMITVIADSGARPGEVCAQRAEEIDENGIWVISNTLRRDRTSKGTTKTGRVRAIKLSPDAQRAIELYGQRRGYVWLNIYGRTITTDALLKHITRFRVSLQKKWDAEAKVSGAEPRIVPPLTPRDLRKTFVTRAVDSSGVKAAQSAVGHKSSKTTMDVYAKGKKDAGVDLIASLTKGVKRRDFTPKTPIGERNRGTNEEGSSSRELA